MILFTIEKNNRMNKIIQFAIFLIIMPVATFSQLIPLTNSHYNRIIQSEIYNPDSRFHTSIKPIYYCDIEELLQSDSLPNPFKSGFYAEWITENDNSVYLQAMPLVDVMIGAENHNEKYIYNIGGGVLFTAGVGNKLGIKTSVSYNYLRPPHSFILNKDSLNILHSWGFLNGARNYSNSNNTHSVTYRPYEYLTFELGYGKNFYGDGYRSLLLSYNSYNYPYFKLETNFLDFKYSYMIAQLKNIGDATSPVWSSLQSKYVVFHYLNWKITNSFSIALFESITMHQDVGFDANYLNPVILLRPVEFYLGSQDNAMMGLNAKLNLNRNNVLYGQVAVGDMVVGLLLNDIRRSLNMDFEGEYGWFANKWGIQGGYKSFEPFGLSGFNLFAEFNITRPYMYSHVFHEQNYSHFGQELAHPLGANFIEYIVGTEYVHKDFNISLKAMYAQIGADTANTHFGQDIFKPTMDGPHNPYFVQSYNNVVLQGNLTTQLTTWLHFEYIINHASFLSINAGIVNRNISPEIGEKLNHTYFYIGFSSSLNGIERLF